MRSRSNLAEARKTIQPTLWEKFSFLGGISLSATSQRTAELDQLSEAYRVRCEERADEKVILEYIERCGEHALTQKWVQDKMRFARGVLDSDFSTLERMLAALDPTPPMVYVADLNGPPISREVAIAKMRKLANSFLRAIGPALANVGSGQISTLSLEVRQENRQKSNRKAGAKRSHNKTADRLANKVRGEEEWLMKKKGMGQKEARREAYWTIVREWQLSTPAKNQESILAILIDKLAN